MVSRKTLRSSSQHTHPQSHLFSFSSYIHIYSYCAQGRGTSQPYTHIIRVRLYAYIWAWKKHLTIMGTYADATFKSARFTIYIYIWYVRGRITTIGCLKKALRKRNEKSYTKWKWTWILYIFYASVQKCLLYGDAESCVYIYSICIVSAEVHSTWERVFELCTQAALYKHNYIYEMHPMQPTLYVLPFSTIYAILC